ncbi:MAG: UDP-N-acetylglucosamine 1-carboxyvinyltransferase [Firmicutes bacterium]|nr:UDP-N-acetylglucosamine 1-carboxyvinyltransferase [Bacillota bacterium]
MESYYIEGGIPLRGEYRVKGAKNSALPILAATVCHGGVYEIYDCPKIGDVFAMLEILNALGSKTKWEDECLVVDSRNVDNFAVPESLMSEMRSSVFLMGSLLARSGEAIVYRPGGCHIGKRPIDIHIAGLEQLGFEVDVTEGRICCKGVCSGGKITMPYPSVGATENLMMAALAGKGDTIIENCAIEPEIVDLQGFLRTIGFQVFGAGTDTIFVKGAHGMADSKSALQRMYFVLEDRIEAATYMAAVMGTGGRAVFRNIRPCLMKDVLDVFERMGGEIRTCQNMIEIWVPQNLKSAGIVVTQPYPGFPTDCQPQLMTLCTKARGLSTIREEIFECRFGHKNQLIKMGADIETCGKNAIIRGVDFLHGGEVDAMDLRGGAALAIAGLMATGRTVVRDVFHVQRGYEDFEKGIKSLGGLIETRRETEKEKTQKI